MTQELLSKDRAHSSILVFVGIPCFFPAFVYKTAILAAIATLTLGEITSKYLMLILAAISTAKTVLVF